MIVACEGRYEARDHGPERPWTSAVVTDDGTWHELADRPDAERAALVGRRVAVRADGIVAIGALERVEPVPAEAPGPRAEVEVIEISLETSRDRAPAVGAPPPAVTVVPTRASVRYYRYLYDAVGAPWHWWNRKRWSDDRLAAWLADPRVEVHVLHEHGTPVGYVELDRREPATCEVAYFGLVAEATGRGLGRWFLGHAIALAWRDPALARLWVHTCNLDGPAALHTYRRLGFVAYKHDRFTQVIASGGLA